MTVFLFFVVVVEWVLKRLVAFIRGKSPLFEHYHSRMRAVPNFFFVYVKSNWQQQQEKKIIIYDLEEKLVMKSKNKMR